METDNNIQLPELILGDIRKHPGSEKDPNLLTKVRIDRPHDISLWFTVRKSKKEDSKNPLWTHPSNRQRWTGSDGQARNYDDFQFRSDAVREHYEKFAMDETEKFLKSEEKSSQTEDKKTSTEEA